MHFSVNTINNTSLGFANKQNNSFHTRADETHLTTTKTTLFEAIEDKNISNIRITKIYYNLLVEYNFN